MPGFAQLRKIRKIYLKENLEKDIENIDETIKNV